MGVCDTSWFLLTPPVMKS